MEKPSTKDVHNFAAGVLALMGLSGLIRLPHDLTGGSEIMGPIAASIAALALPLAIGILAQSGLALRLTQLYLGLAVVIGWIGVGILAWILPRQRWFDSAEKRYVTSLLLLTVLLGMFCWTKSSNREGKQGAQTVAGKARAEDRRR